MFQTSQQVINWLLQATHTPSPPSDLRLQQLRALLEQASLKPTCPIITITGTNGKGSSVQVLANILKHANYRVGSFTSPHLQRYHERICINGQSIDDEAFITAANAIHSIPEPIPSHFFNRLLLIALYYFKHQAIDVLVLEVGVGGRLDPCNALEADIIGITRVALDHQDLLGADREHIGFEKAGLMRKGRIAVIGEADMPDSIPRHSRAIGGILRVAQQHFHSQPQEPDQFQWQGSHWLLTHLPKPTIMQSNVDLSLAILEAMAPHLPVTLAAIRIGLHSLSIKGRYQWLRYQQRSTLLDIAHNPDAIAHLVERLQQDCPQQPIRLIFGMMADKAWRESLNLLMQLPLSQVYLCPIHDPRALASSTLAKACLAQDIPHQVCPSVANALHLAHSASQTAALIVVTGSCRLVGEALDWFDEHLEPFAHTPGIETQQAS